MQIGSIIKKCRKEKNMTQEELANRLGVTAPAVNKWENDVSLPDISLLAPIARLFGITLDQLLSFQESLTAEEIAEVIKEVDGKFETDAYDTVFQYAKGLIQTYPGCYPLIWQLALLLYARQKTAGIADAAYENQILQWYTNVLESSDTNLKQQAAGSLFQLYFNKGEYQKAKQYLLYFSEDSTERKIKQALLLGETGQEEEACRIYEEILFAEYHTLYMVMYHLYRLSVRKNDLGRARMWAEKESGLALLFDMGQYRAEICRLELAVAARDVSQTVSSAKILLDAAGRMDCFQESAMYAHMHWKPADRAFPDKVKKILAAYFLDHGTFGYMQGYREWEGLAEHLA